MVRASVAVFLFFTLFGMLGFPGSHTTLHAAGWHDYERPIGDGYSIVRANAMSITLAHSDSFSTIVPPYPVTVGPIIGYRMLDAYVLTRHSGIDTQAQDIRYSSERSQVWYFIVPKATKQAIGPLSESEFQRLSSELGIPPDSWQVPRNPNFWVPLLGSLLFLAVALLFLFIHFYYVSIPVLLITAWLFCRSLKKRRERKRSQSVKPAG